MLAAALLAMPAVGRVAPGGRAGRRNGRRGRCRPGRQVSALRDPTLANGLQVIVVIAPRAAGGEPAPADSRRRRAPIPRRRRRGHLAAALLDQGTTTRQRRRLPTPSTRRRRPGHRRRHGPAASSNVARHEGQPRLRVDLLATWCGIPPSRTTSSNGSASRRSPGLKVSYEDPDYIAGVVFDRLVYGLHPYGLPNTGTPESLQTLTTRRPAGVSSHYFAPNNCDSRHRRRRDDVRGIRGRERAFGGWARRDVPPYDGGPGPSRRAAW